MSTYLTNEIIKSSADNSAGTLLDKYAIDNIVNKLTDARRLDTEYVDFLIAENESESGYMVKTGDFIYFLSPYILGEGLEESSTVIDNEKDYELIELLYGDFHAECGCR